MYASQLYLYLAAFPSGLDLLYSGAACSIYDPVVEIYNFRAHRRFVPSSFTVSVVYTVDSLIGRFYCIPFCLAGVIFEPLLIGCCYIFGAFDWLLLYLWCFWLAIVIILCALDLLLLYFRRFWLAVWVLEASFWGKRLCLWLDDWW